MTSVRCCGRSRISRDRSSPGQRRGVQRLSIGNIYRSKGEREKALHHCQVALGIASPFNWQDQLFWVHESLAWLFLDEGAFDDATAHVEQARSYVVEDRYTLGRAIKLQAEIWASTRQAQSRQLRSFARTRDL